MIIIGTNNIAAAYVGATAVEKAYVGNNQIYPNTSLTLSASELSFAAAGQSLTLDIVVDENKPWTITAPNDWQVSPLSGTGPASITVTAANNTSANRRESRFFRRLPYLRLVTRTYRQRVGPSPRN